MSTYPSFRPHKCLAKITEFKIVVRIQTIAVQRLYLISKQEGASGKKTINIHWAVYTRAFFLPLINHANPLLAKFGRQKARFLGMRAPRKAGETRSG